MARNKIPDIHSRLWALAADAADGLMGHGVEIQIAQNTEDRVRTDLAASKAAESDMVEVMLA